MIRVLVEKVGATWDVVELRPDRTRANVLMRVRVRAVAERYAHRARMATWRPPAVCASVRARAWATTAWVVLVLVLGAAAAARQTAVGHAERYSLRRTTVLAPTLTYPFRGGYQLVEIVEAAAVTCGLPHGAPTAPGFRIDDRVTAGADCEWIAPPNRPIFAVTKDATYNWALAQQFDGAWSDAVPPEYRGPEPTTPQNVKIRAY